MMFRDTAIKLKRATSNRDSDRNESWNQLSMGHIILNGFTDGIAEFHMKDNSIE